MIKFSLVCACYLSMRIVLLLERQGLVVKSNKLTALKKVFDTSEYSNL